MTRIYGVIPARVVSEPDELGRVRVQIGYLADNSETYETYSYFAPIASFMSGKERGAWFMPEIGDDVLVAFEQGNVEKPYVLGFLWNGDDPPPSTDRQERIVYSVNGHKIVIYDPDVSSGDMGYIRIEDGHGNMIELSNATITIRGVGTIQMQAPTIMLNNRVVALTPAPL
jgi:uncharacterized protein involved in type VI secretion and phage assembly